jgi:hypothetical protein
MLGSDSMIGEGWYKELIVIPKPLNNYQYYIFQAPVTQLAGLAYSLVDMTIDNGLGAVVQKNIRLLDSTYWVADGLAAIKHGNGRDWWVIHRHWELPKNNEYMFYIVTPDSIYLHHTQNIGDLVQSSVFRIEPSHDGNTMACVTNKGLLCVYDFDRCSGMLTNEIAIEHENPNANKAPMYWDCELSANKKYLYVSKITTTTDTANLLLRYDLQASNIAASKDTLYAAANPAQAGLIELAPDGRMYWSCAFYDGLNFNYPHPDSLHNYITDNLSVVNFPDSDACDFQPFSFYLGGKRTYYGLPNNPNYELGPLVGSPCDTLAASTPPANYRDPKGKVQCTYIGAWQKLFVNAQNLQGHNVTITIYDLTAKKVTSEKCKVMNGYATKDIDCSNFASGVYVVHLQTEKESLSKKFVKE